ncbi:hypothetical protein ACHAPT_013163 [Fusarium lateritium]
MVTPLSMNIDYDEAKKVMDNFPSSCLVNASCCAVSGLGESWCVSPTIGPALQACHIVPQQHYHLYPGIDACSTDCDDEESARRIQQAWSQTWNAKNGILLMSHLHQLFDARLFSIHPETLRIRAFVSYNVILPYHGQEARLPDDGGVDLEALRHHYEMSSIENMAAEMPLVELIPTKLTTPGSISLEQDNVTDSYITPWNSRRFLADVNWELHKYTLR